MTESRADNNDSSSDALTKFRDKIEGLQKNKINRANAFENRMIDEINNMFIPKSGTLIDEKQ